MISINVIKIVCERSVPLFQVGLVSYLSIQGKARGREGRKREKEGMKGKGK